MMRIEKIRIQNFKNVEDGTVTFRNGNTFDHGSVLGIYGQNGSGKTALIESLQLLKFCMMGNPIPERYIKMINVNSESSSFEFLFYDQNESGSFQISYSFDLSKGVAETEGNNPLDENRIRFIPAIGRQMLSYSVRNTPGERKKTKVLYNDSYTDESSLAEQIKKSFHCDADPVDIIYAVRKAGESGRSFLFSNYLYQLTRENENEENAVLHSLIRFANEYLFIIRNEESGIINLHGGMPFNFYLSKPEERNFGSVLLPFDGNVNVPAEIVDVAEKTIVSLNAVLPDLVPGLTIKIERLGESLDQNGNKVVNVILVSVKNGKPIPLEYESEGIKKIISVLNLLIACFNRPEIVVAIDEIDSGIYEYLLGEILQVMSEGAKGQLVFTSHNLRPLEVLNSKDVLFTTTNPANRYIHMKYLKRTNNLRDTYYREIQLDGQDEKLYDSTYSSDIAHAFRKAARL